MIIEDICSEMEDALYSLEQNPSDDERYAYAAEVSKQIGNLIEQLYQPEVEDE